MKKLQSIHRGKIQKKPEGTISIKRCTAFLFIGKMQNGTTRCLIAPIKLAKAKY